MHPCILSSYSESSDCSEGPKQSLGGSGSPVGRRFLEEGLMDPGLQVTGGAQLCSHGFPSALQSPPGSGSVVVTAAYQGQVAAGSLAGCHTAVFRRWRGLRGVPDPPRPVSPGSAAFACSPRSDSL